MARKATKKTTKKVSPLKGRMKTPPWPDHPEWSEAKFWQFLRSGLRAMHNRWPPKYRVMNEGKRPYKGTDRRIKHEVHCQGCDRWFPGTASVQCDHVIPTGSLKSWDDWAAFTQRMFTNKSGYQRLCTECHSKKTQEERSKKDE